MFSRIMAKVLSGEATEQERQQVQQWSDISEENKKLLKLSEEAWQQLETKSLMPDADAVFKDIESQIDQKGGVSGFTKTRHLIGNIGYWMAAASVAVVALFLYQNYTDTPANTPQTTQQWVRKTNGLGEKSRIFLADGTVVWLNAQSTLTYTKPFSSENRQVELEGEAYFDVAHDPRHPFSVKTGNVVTTALGTSFNIQAYREDSFVDVNLQSGKVLVSLSEPHHDNQLFIKPGEKVRVDKSQNRMHKSTFDPAHELAWKDGVLSFKNATFDQVITKLSRWYGVDFTVNNRRNDFKEWNYTARFQNDYLSSILQGMSFTKNFEYVIEDEKVTITFKNMPMKQ